MLFLVGVVVHLSHQDSVRERSVFRNCLDCPDECFGGRAGAYVRARTDPQGGLGGVNKSDGLVHV